MRKTLLVFLILLNFVSAQIVWASDASGNEKDTFTNLETVYVTTAVSFSRESVDIYIMYDFNFWSKTSIPRQNLEDLSGGFETVIVDENGKIPTTAIWENPRFSDVFDIIIDSDRDGFYGGGDIIDHAGLTGFTVDIPTGCIGDILLSFTPSYVTPSEDVLAAATGLYFQCNGKIIAIRQGSCDGPIVCQITSEEDGGSCSFQAPSEGEYSYYACIDKNANGHFLDTGEMSAAILTVPSQPADQDQIDQIDQQTEEEPNFALYIIIGLILTIFVVALVFLFKKK